MSGSDGARGVAVVIVTFNSRRHVERNLPAVVDQLGDGDELVVVDNASSDGTPGAVRTFAPSARLVEAGANLGFAGGCNAGAGESSAPLLLFLNPDARPAPGAVETLRRTAQEQPEWGLWQALVELPDGGVNTSGNLVHFLGLAWAGTAAAPESASEVAVASGAALMVRREAWERVGGFDDRFFMYHEDVDLALRARRLGYGVGIAPSARVVHDYEFEKGADKWFYMERNRWWVVIGCYPARLLLALMPVLLAAEAALLVAAATGGWLGPKLRADAAVLASLPWALRRRRAIRKRGDAGATAIARVLTPDLSSDYFGGVARSTHARMLLRAYWRFSVAVGAQKAPPPGNI